MNTSSTSLESSWLRAWSQLGLPAPDGLYERLLEAYGESYRHYHTQQHLSECIAHLEPALSLAVRPGEVELALWFHDAIYELKARDNELRSADWAAAELARSGGSGEQARRVHALIMATRHDAAPADPDQQLLVDVDLAILGADPTRFAEYDAQVRAEYRWVPGFVYRVKRLQVLRSFLDRPAIYSTAHFSARLEATARSNLRRATGR